MANNKILVEIQVTDGGTAKIVQRNIDAVGQSAERTTKRTRDAGKAQDEYTYKLNQGTTGVSSAARSFSKLNQAIGNGPNGLVGAYATLAANAFAVSAAFNKLREAAQVEQMMKGLEVQGARTGRSLKNVSNSLQELTGYSISASDAMSTVALMSSAGFSTSSMESLTKVATNAAYALGRNVPDALDRISKGVTKLEPELLDELGIMTKLTEAQSTYALQNHKSVASLTSFEKRQAMLNAVIAEGEAKFGGLSDQVEANPYDKLAASFDNLIKSGLGFFNNVLGPIASVFSNQGMLLGGILLFVSTIRKQLLPALYLMGKVAQERRQHFVDMAKDSRDAARAASELADAEQKRAIANKTSTFIEMEGKAKTPKSFDFESAAINALDKNRKEYEKNISTLDKSINSRTKNIKAQEQKLSTVRKIWSDEFLAEKKKELQEIENTKKALKELYEIQEQGEVATSKAKLRAAAENTRYYANIQGARAADARSQAIELAGEGKIKEAMQRRTVAAQNYRRQALLDARASNIEAGRGKQLTTMDRAAVGLKTTLFSIGSGAQVAGAAFMKFIPYIGMAMTALSGAWSIYENFFRSDAVKAQIEALKKYKEVLDNTKKSIDEINRLQEANISIGQRASQTLIIQSNATAEIAGALDEVKKATAAAAKDNKVDSLWEVMIGSPDDAVAYATGVAKDSAFFEPLAKELQNSTGSYLGTAVGAGLLGALGTFVAGPAGTVVGGVVGGWIGNNIGVALAETLPEEFNGIDELAVASLKSIDQLSRLINKELYDSFVSAAGGSDVLANSEVMREEVINRIASAYAGLSEAISDLQEAFKQAGTAVDEFFTSAVKKTPFDSLVTSFQAIDRAIYNINKTVAGSADLESQFALLTEMPDSLMRTLTAGQQQTLLQAKNINSQVNVYRTEIEKLQAQMQDADESRKAELNTQIQQQQTLLNSEKAKLEPLQSSTREIQAQLTHNKNLFEQYQDQTRTIDNQLKLHNAIMTSEQELYALSAEGEARRIDMHNQQIRLQQAQLNVQIAMIDMYLAQQRANQLLLRQELAKLNASRELHKENAAASAREFAATRDAQRADILREAANTNSEASARSRLDSLDKYIQGLKTATTQAERESDLATLTNATLASRMHIGGVALNDAERAYFYAAQSAAVTELQTQNLETQEGITQSIHDLEASRASLAAEVAALAQSSISDAEKEARVNQVSVKLAEKVNALGIENTNLTAEQTDLQTKINNVVSGRTKLLSQELLASVRRNASELNTLTNERRRFEEENSAHIATIASMRAESKMQEAGLQNLQEEHRLTLANYDLKIQNLQKSSELLIFETLLKDGVEGTLQSVKDSLDYYQKRLDLTKELNNQESEIKQNAAKISILRQGGTVDERTQSQLAVEAAAEQRAQAHEQYALRVMSINAEYDLLDAQRSVQLENMKFQRYAISAFWKIMNGNAPLPQQLQGAIDNLDRSVGALEGLTTTSMRNLALASAANEVILADQRYELARLERDNSAKNRPAWFGAMANMRERQSSRTREEAAIQRGNNPVNQIQEQYKISYETQKKALQPVVDSLQRIEVNQRSATSNPVGLVASNDNPTSPTPVSTTATRGTRQLTEMLNPNGYNINFSDPFATALTAALNDYFDSTGRVNRIDLQSGVRSTRRQQEIWDAGYTDSSGQRRTRAGRPIATPGTSKHESANAADLPSAIEAALTSGGFLQRHGLANIPGDPGHVQLASNRTTATVLTAAANGSAPLSVLVTNNETPANGSSTSGMPTSPITLPSTDASANIGKLTEGTQTLGQAATSTMGPLQKLFDFMVSGSEVAAGMMQDIVSQASERLGVDFGPQGRIFSSINSTMQMLPSTFASIQGAFGQNFSKSWEQFDAERNKQNASLKASVEAQGKVWDEAMGDMTTKGQFHAQKLSDAFMAASQVIGSIGSILKASSDAKLASIDREIAAEQKRDGKSAASVAKIDSLEKKKDAIARRSFNTQKKLMIAQAVMSTAAAIAGQLASPPVGPWNIAMAAMMGALGLAQVAMIAGTQYESTYSPKTVDMPSSLSIGKHSDTVNLASGPNANAGGEVGYLRGSAGTGTSASDYKTIGSAYGGDLTRGYGNRGFIVGEKGPELITPETPINVTPANSSTQPTSVHANISIHALDASDVKKVLLDQRGNIIDMLREAANNNGQKFLEGINTNVYTRPNVGKL